MAVFIHFTRSVEFLYKTPPAKLEIGLIMCGIGRF